MSPPENSVDDKSTIDNNTSSSADNSAGETQGQEASADPAQESQPGDTGDATSTGDEGATPPEAGADGNPSLTPPKPSNTKPIPWEKRFKDLEPEFQRRSQELKRYQSELRQYEGIDAAAIRQWKEQQAHAQRANLPQWDPSHPEKAKFDSLEARWAFGNKFLNAHQKHPAFDEMLQNMQAQFTPQERQLMANWDQHQKAENIRYASNPALRREEARKEAQEVFQSEFQRMSQEHAQRQQAEQHVEGWFKNPANKGVIENFGQAMYHQLQQGVPWHIVQRDAENAHLRSQLGTGKQTVAAAEEQRRLAKGNASITRDPATNEPADLYKEALKLAKKRGIRPGSAQFMPIVHEVEARARADSSPET